MHHHFKLLCQEKEEEQCETAGCASGERREGDRATTKEGDTEPDRLERDGSYDWPFPFPSQTPLPLPSCRPCENKGLSSILSSSRRRLPSLALSFFLPKECWIDFSSSNQGLVSGLRGGCKMGMVLRERGMAETEVIHVAAEIQSCFAFFLKCFIKEEDEFLCLGMSFLPKESVFISEICETLCIMYICAILYPLYIYGAVAKLFIVVRMENTVYNLGSAFNSTLISNMNIGYNPALCNPEAKITPSQSELHRYYHFSADSDSTLQKGTGTLFGTELEVTMWWKIWVHNYKERKRGWMQSFSLSISFLSQFTSLVVGVRLPPQGLIILGLNSKVRVGFRGGRGWGAPVNCGAAQLFLYKMTATTTLSKSDGSGCSICVNLPVQLDSAMFSK
ncbi:unnamed protein product [Malus baccata var. baccata]